MRARLLFLLMAAIPAVVSAESMADWLRNFYNDRGICAANTNVGEIKIADSQLIAYLDVEDNYLKRVQGGGKEIVDDWLALHCPFPLAAYESVFSGHDIVIVANESLSLSCRSYKKSW